MTLPNPKAHETESIRAEFEAREWMEDFTPTVDTGVDAIETEQTKRKTDVEELVAGQERTGWLRAGLIPVAKSYEEFETTMQKIDRDKNLSDEGKREKRQDARQKLETQIETARGNFVTQGQSLIGENYRKQPDMSNDEVARLNLKLLALASASPRRIIEETWDAIRDGRHTEADHLIAAHERQLERSSPHWRPYLSLWRQVVDAGRVVINGTEWHHRERAARELVGSLTQQFEWAVATTKNGGEFDDMIWTGCPDFHRGEK